MPKLTKLETSASVTNYTPDSGHITTFFEDDGKGGIVLKYKDSTGEIHELSGGSDISDTTAVESDVLAGKVFHKADGSLTSGSITSINAQTITPTTANQTITSGNYLAGDQTILGDSNLVAANIASGVTIFNVTGTHQGGGGGEEAVAGYFINNSGTVTFMPCTSGSVAEAVDTIKIVETGVAEPAYSKGGAGSDFYKCATVGTSTWQGYKATTDSETGITTFSETLSDLGWTVEPAPIVGNVYTADGFSRVIVREPAAPYIFYAPLHSSVAYAETGQELTEHGTVSFQLVDGITAFTNASDNNYITFPDSDLPSGGSDRTISMLFNASDLESSHRIFFYGTKERNKAFVINQSFTRSTIGVEYYGDEVLSDELSTNTWYHVVARLENGVTSIWINSVQQNSDELAVNTVLTGDAYIGKLPDELYIEGSLCELKIYDRALTAAEINTEYERLMALFN